MSDDAPPHIRNLPRLDDANFVYRGYDGQDAARIHAAAIGLFADIDTLTQADATKYFVLGSYKSPQSSRDGPKDRLKRAAERFRTEPKAAGFLLEELDPDNEEWGNFYLKYRYALVGTDYAVFVVEDNDGGHELELGTAPLETTYILKRDYTLPSIDNDLEYEKYDAMMATLCSLMEKNGHLYTWQTTDDLDVALSDLIDDTLP
ncbi:hypothetical protein ACFQJC_02045 [Haloferax namakaokahaiae]|uniref:Uncharacterized protein n=1 Tax=Haloferax namakaokahaiae TaxID=1748331 RepID=A0ABD5ZAQ4_9EURY